MKYLLLLFPTLCLARIPVDFFGTAGCDTCQRLKTTLIPEILETYGPDIAWTDHDITVENSLLLLLAYRTQFHGHANEPVSIVIDRATLLQGEAPIRAHLSEEIDTALQRRLENPAYQPPPPPETTLQHAHTLRQTFTWSAVILGGLLDGINPCALTTLIFFLSLLTLTRTPTRTRLHFTLGFILATFLLYTLLGFGLIRLLTHIPLFQQFRTLFIYLIALLLLLAALTTLLTLNRKAPLLALPDTFRQRIRRTLTSGLRAPAALLSGLTSGLLVTLLESVCTGQGYIPVLTLILRHAPTNAHIWAMLLLYNLLFILPLILVAILCHFGLKAIDLAAFSRRHLRLLKILTALFFILLATLLFLIG